MVGGRTLAYIMSENGRRISEDEYIATIIQDLKEQINRLNNMSPEEAHVESLASLVQAGIMNEDGTFTAPYAPDSNVQ